MKTYEETVTWLADIIYKRDMAGGTDIWYESDREITMSSMIFETTFDKMNDDIIKEFQKIVNQQKEKS